jgi:serine/threonine-protein kinase
MTADRHLLFGLLALQNGIIDQDQLLAAFRAWTLDRSKSLAEHLALRGDLDEEDRAAIEALAARHLKRHGGDVEQSLAALNAGRSTRESLARLADGDIEASLAHLAATSVQPAEDTDRTASYGIGTATSDGSRFRVLRPHARGGLGAVFVALDTELHREVALKQMLDHHADDASSRQRFLVEAEVTGGLEHPGIVPVYGLGTYGDGRPYYAMRFIRGDSLKEEIEGFHADGSSKKDSGRQTLELRKLLRRFTDVCNALEYAHTRGVLHRDIKPGNIIVGKHGETLVVDWGLAKATGHSEPGAAERTLMPSSASGSAETLPGTALGTPAYMSPEQAAGELDRLGPRSDVYSLGATLYCLLTGKPPQEGDDIGEVLRKVQRGEFSPPRQIDGSIDPALEAVCLKAMATRPEDRYGSARALVEDVERWMADEPVFAWREPLSRRAQRWGRRNRPLVTAAAAAVLVALAGLGAVLAVQRGANRVLAAKNADLNQANTSLREAIQQKDAANTALGEANGRVQARFELAREAIRSFKEGVEEEEALKENRLRPLRDKLLGSARRFYDRLGDLLKGQTDAASKAVLAESYIELADLIDRIGQKPEALAAFKKAVTIRRELAAASGAGASELVKLADALNGLGFEARQLGDHDGSLAAHEEAVALAEPMAAEPGATLEARRALGTAHHRAGLALNATGAAGRALAEYRRARAVRQALVRDPGAVPDDRLELTDTIQDIGILLERTGDTARALAEQRAALEVLRALTAEHPSVAQYRFGLAFSHENVGDLLEKTGDLAGSLAEQRKAQELRRALAAEHPAVTDYRRELAGGHNRIGSLLERIGDLAGSLAEQRKSQELFRALAAEHPEVPAYRSALAGSHSWVGILLAQTGDMAGALAEERKHQELSRTLAAEHPEVPDYRRDLADSHGRVGRLLQQTGDLAGALAEYRKDQEMCRALAAEHPEVLGYRRYLAVAHNDVGVVLEKTGDLAGALAEQRKSQELFRALAAEHPEVPDYRRNLANSHVWVGILLEKTGDLAGALAEQRKDQELFRALAAEHPEVPDYRRNLAVSHNRVGILLTTAGRPADALAELERARSLLEALTKASPSIPDYREALAAALDCAGDALRDLGRSGEARDHQARAVALAEALAAAYPKVPSYRADLADSLRRLAWLKLDAGDAAETDADARRAVKLFEALPSRHGREWFSLACARVTLAAAIGRGETATSAAPESSLADQAMNDLRQAAATGYRSPAVYRHEPALGLLRGRDDFQLLMMDLAMPAAPFAAAR